ncbi:uncharacterized protein EKO05_0011041 [Ascochyta rabiei]|uniref:Cysteine-type peptidase n=1 Tax=Didymella rabiei TaxID=5454 RepID=A0A163LZA5_DIDRA|nr:uncharacterized protein EKO05_0011041 [Ascochyta rabiei]KZM28255.1 cysteine-type peptidase [Ascochyta rabiei]UPX20823.1 hypothetical protein EKO05_0011041 [Ascochyta rabiei]
MTMNAVGGPVEPETVPSSPTEPLTPRDEDEETVTQWLNNKYIRYDLEDGTDAWITMEEFLNIVHTDFPECYMPDQTLVLSLELSARKWNRSNTVIISDVHAQKLYQLGIGTYTRAEVLEMCATLQPTLLNLDKRWIIIPCSDGILDLANVGESSNKNNLTDDEPTVPSSKKPSRRPAVSKEPILNKSLLNGSQDLGQCDDEKKEKKEKKKSCKKKGNSKKESSKEPKGPVQHGTHWGLLIIDKTQKVARWVDSIITLEQRSDKPKKLKFGHMHPTAIAAGRVLCGIDTLLGEDHGFSKGGFTTSTLKYVPQQATDNSYSGNDGGPCGPFMFAFLEHIFERATTLDQIGLRKMFPRSERGQLRFDSMLARRELRRLIQQEAERPGVVPFQLSPDLLRILNVLPVEQLQRSVDAYRDKAATPILPDTKRLSGVPRNFKPDSNFMAAFRQDKIDNPDIYKSVGDVEAQALFYSLQQSKLASHAGEAGANGSGPESQDSNKTIRDPTADIYLGRQRYCNVPLDDKTIWPAHEKCTEGWPRSVKELPDFTEELKKGSIGAWVRKHPKIREHKETDKKHSDATSCAMLHLKYKKTFLGEPDDNFEAVWSNDETVFNPHDPRLVAIKNLQDDRLRNGEIRLMMMQHYETDRLTGLLAYLARYKPKAPGLGSSNNNDKDSDDDDDGGGDNDEPQDSGIDKSGKSNGSDDDNRSGAGQSEDENGGAPPDPDQNGSGLDGNNTDSNESIDGNTSGWDQPTAKPVGLQDFRTMFEVDLAEFQTPDKLADPRLHQQNVNTVSWRAFLFVTEQGENFGEENDHNCTELWLRDTVVFSDEEREADWEGLTGVIRSRMEAHYCRDTSPSPTPRADQIYLTDEFMEVDSNSSLSSAPSEWSGKSKDSSNDLGTASPKRKREEEDGNYEDASSNKSKKHSKSGFGVPARTPTDSMAKLPEQTSNNRKSPSWSESTKDKLSSRNAQHRQAMGGMKALQDAAKTIQASADGLESLKFPALAVSTTHASEEENAGDRFSETYRRTRSTRSSAGSSSAAGGGDDSSGSESLSKFLRLSDAPDSDESGHTLDSSTSSSGSEDSDSGGGNISDCSRKHHRESEDDDTENEIGAAKRPKTSRLPSSGRSRAKADSNNSHIDDSDYETIADEQILDPQISLSFESEATVEDPIIEIYIGQELYILNLEDTSLFLPWDTTKQDWPNNVTKLPDFAHMDALDFKLWYQASPELKLKATIHNDRVNLVTYRAALHMKFKKTFLHEQDANFSTVWINDTTVFDAATVQRLQAIEDPGLRNGEVRFRIMTAYEPAMLQRLHDLPKPVPKLTVQVGSFEDPESFKSDTTFVQMSRKPDAHSDPTLLLPEATRATKRP